MNRFILIYPYSHYCKRLINLTGIPVFIAILILFSGCKKNNNTTATFDTSYYPLNIKSWIVYDITTVKFEKDINGQMIYNDSSHYLLKEIIDTSYIDFSGRLNFRIERYRKDSLNSSWQIKDVWTTCLTDYTALKNEENITYVKIKFPIEKNKTWNGNLYNTLNAQNYKITAMDAPETINNNFFQNVLSITQANTLNAIQKFYAYEKYAKNIGLIKKHIFNIYDVTYPSTTEPIENRMKRVEKYTQEIISWGQE